MANESLVLMTPLGSSATNGTVPYHFEIERIILAIILVVFAILGTYGNSIVILAIILSRKLRTPTNWLVLNLACADLLTSLYLPFQCVALLSPVDWFVPSWLCIMFAKSIYVFVGVSITTHALIGFTRWYLITRSRRKFNRVLKSRNMVIIIVLCWAQPIVWTQAYEITDHFGRYSMKCNLYRLSGQMVSPNTLSDVLTGFWVLLHFAIIVIFYVKIFRFIGQQRRKIGVAQQRRNLTERQITGPSGFRHSNQQELPVVSSNLRVSAITGVLENNDNVTEETNANDPPAPLPSRRIPEDRRLNTARSEVHGKFIDVTKNLTIVVIAFFVCFFPFLICASVPAFSRAMSWTSVLLTGNSCVNPIIYARNIPAFREVMRGIVRCRYAEIPMPIEWLRRKTRPV